MNNPTVVMPPRIARLARDKHGHPIPWFVHIDRGVPDFRVVRGGGIEDAMRFGWCWVCGQPRGRHATFTIGPMCGVNRVSAEPPAHLECAVYSARACPFLSNPNMVRRDRGLSPYHMAEGALLHNPGVALVWSSRTWRPVSSPGGDALFDVGAPTSVSWWCRGREATRVEVLTAIDTRLPLLLAEAEKDGPAAVAEVTRQHRQALQLVPA
ncbi:MAG: hypothetical protein ACRDRO_04100 [Pseudonocardiaceae bacterium]